MKLTTNQRLTLILINDMAMCIRREVEVQEYLDGPTRKIKYRKKGDKQRLYTSLIEAGTLVFDGWNLPLRVDTDGSSTFHGNGSYNFVAPAPEEIKSWVQNKNLNDRFIHTDLILFHGPSGPIEVFATETV